MPLFTTYHPIIISRNKRLTCFLLLPECYYVFVQLFCLFFGKGSRGLEEDRVWKPISKTPPKSAVQLLPEKKHLWTPTKVWVPHFNLLPKTYEQLAGPVRLPQKELSALVRESIEHVRLRMPTQGQHFQRAGRSAKTTVPLVLPRPSKDPAA